MSFLRKQESRVICICFHINQSIDGFQTLIRENFIVSVGRTTRENIILKQTTLEESVTVTAEPPTIDVSKSSFTTNYGKDELKKLPTGRFSYYDILKLAPGMQQTYQDSALTIAFDSNSESNSYRMDGSERCS